MSSLPPKPSTSMLPIDLALAREITTSLQIQYKGQRAKDLLQTARPTTESSVPSVSPPHLVAEATHIAEFSKDLLALGMPPHLLKKYPPSPVLNSGMIKCEWNVPANSIFRGYLRGLMAGVLSPHTNEVLNRHLIACIRYRENGTLVKLPELRTAPCMKAVLVMNEATRCAWNASNVSAPTPSGSKSVDVNNAAPSASTSTKRKLPADLPNIPSKRGKPGPSTPPAAVTPKVLKWLATQPKPINLSPQPSQADRDPHLKLISELQEQLEQARQEHARLSERLAMRETQVSDRKDERMQMAAAANEREHAMTKEWMKKYQQLIEEHASREREFSQKWKSYKGVQTKDLQNKLGEAESTVRAQTTEIGRLEQRIKFFEEESQRHADTIAMYRKKDEIAAAARSYEEDAKRSKEQELEAERRGYNEQLAVLRAQVASLESMKDHALLDKALADRRYFQQLYETEKVERAHSEALGHELVARESEAIHAKEQAEEALAEERREHAQLEQAFAALKGAGISAWAIPAMAEAILRIGRLTDDLCAPSV